MVRRRQKHQRGRWDTGLCGARPNHAYRSAANRAQVTPSDRPDFSRAVDDAALLTGITPEHLDTLRRFAALGPAVTADRAAHGPSAPTTPTTPAAEDPDAPR